MNQHPNFLWVNIALYFFGLGGSLIHWLKKTMETEKGQDLASLKKYYSEHMLSTIVAFLSYNLMFFFMWFISTTGKMEPLDVLLYGYSSDSLSKMLQKRANDSENPQ